MRRKLGRGVWAAGLVGVLAALGATAQAGDVKATVPFEFSVNNTALPAGEYTLSTIGASAAVLVRGYRSSALALSNAMEDPKGGTPRLVFHRYGTRYVLREIWTDGTSGRQLPPSRAEHETAGESARWERVEIPLL